MHLRFGHRSSNCSYYRAGWRNPLSRCLKADKNPEDSASSSRKDVKFSAVSPCCPSSSKPTIVLMNVLKFVLWRRSKNDPDSVFQRIPPGNLQERSHMDAPDSTQHKSWDLQCNLCATVKASISTWLNFFWAYLLYLVSRCIKWLKHEAWCRLACFRLREVFHSRHSDCPCSASFLWDIYIMVTEMTQRIIDEGWLRRGSLRETTMKFITLIIMIITMKARKKGGLGCG